MLRSMTGYGRSEREHLGRKFTVEIKSVNHRYNEITIKLPKFLNPFEDAVRKQLSKEIFRGKTDVYIGYESISSDDAEIKINELLADKLVNALSAIKHRYGLKDEISLSLISRFQDVISISKNPDLYAQENSDELTEGLTLTVADALKSFILMREREGEALKLDITAKFEVIAGIVDEISLLSSLVVSEHYDKLQIRLRELLVKKGLPTDVVDENRIAAEIALFADKCSIDEEITRLKSHIHQMGFILSEYGSIGRKLDFLVQEMNREANTIASKSNNIELTKFSVSLKSEIEKIREQVQNIE